MTLRYDIGYMYALVRHDENAFVTFTGHLMYDDKSMAIRVRNHLESGDYESKVQIVPLHEQGERVTPYCYVLLKKSNRTGGVYFEKYNCYNTLFDLVYHKTVIEKNFKRTGRKDTIIVRELKRITTCE